MVGPLLLLLIIVGAGTWAATRPADDVPYVAPVPARPAGPTVDAVGAASALQDLVSAMATGDRDAARALAGADSGMAARLTDLVDVATAARIEDLTLRYIDDDGGLAADGTWAATVDVTWAYAGFDAEATSTEIAVRFRTVDDRVVLAGLGGGGLRTPVWMSGPMQVSRSQDLLVVAAAQADLGAYVRLARSAVPTVSSVVTTWRPSLVVEVPVDGAALETALGTEPGYYAQIAAVTGAGGALVPGAPVHVFVNPDVFAGLGRAGREVVLAHEVTHVATNAPFSKAPAWLIEGFADYVALRGSRLPLSRTAGQIAETIRTQGIPDELPTAADFDTRGPHLGAVYEASWLACAEIGKRIGPEPLASLFGSVSLGEDFESVLQEAAGWSTIDLIKAWRASLTSLT